MSVRIKKETLDDGFIMVEAYGTSTDTKPVFAGMATGSLFLEVDKGDVYAFDEDAAVGEEWTKIAALGGGS